MIGRELRLLTHTSALGSEIGPSLRHSPTFAHKAQRAQFFRRPCPVSMRSVPALFVLPPDLRHKHSVACDNIKSRPTPINWRFSRPRDSVHIEHKDQEL